MNNVWLVWRHQNSTTTWYQKAIFQPCPTSTWISSTWQFNIINNCYENSDNEWGFFCWRQYADLWFYPLTIYIDTRTRILQNCWPALIDNRSWIRIFSLFEGPFKTGCTVPNILITGHQLTHQKYNKKGIYGSVIASWRDLQDLKPYASPASSSKPSAQK